MKNHAIIILLLCIVSLSGFAVNPDDEDNIYVFTKQSDNPIIYSLNDLDKITFSTTGINFWNTNWPTEYAYEDFRLITFSENDTPNAIEQNEVGFVGLQITYDPQKETVRVNSSKTLLYVTVYDLQGRCVAFSNDVASGFSVSLLSSPRGIYIVEVMTNEGAVSKKIVK